jgi:two-component system CheB/CheR fusion protein
VARAAGPGPAAKKPRRRASFVVALGGSSGGLIAFEQFFAQVAIDTGMAFVVMTHLEPAGAPRLAELLQPRTAMPVREVTDGTRLASDSVYVLPANRELRLEDEILQLGPAAARRGRRVIDGFMRSLAHERGPTAIGVVLAGADPDGAAGLRAILDGGGVVLIEDPRTAALAAMPRAALAEVPDAIVARADALPAAIAARVAIDRPTLTP